MHNQLIHRTRLARYLTLLLLLPLMLILSGCLDSDSDSNTTNNPDEQHPQVRLTLAIEGAAFGDLTLTLYPEQAPISVDNFLTYVDEGFYDGLLIHRVVPGFVIQGGGFDTQGQQQPTRDPIHNESNNGLSNLKGTLAMARTNDPHSATSQFYINLADNPGLDYQPATASQDARWGYAVFGEVTQGMENLEVIEYLPTNANDVPFVEVTIKKAERINNPSNTPTDTGSTP